MELVFAASIEPTRPLLDEKLRLSLSAMHFSPIRQIVYRHAVPLALKGDREAALLQLRGMMEKTPGVYDFLLNEVAEPAKE